MKSYSSQEIAQHIHGQIYSRFAEQPTESLTQYLSDTIYLERKRLHKEPDADYTNKLNKAARTLNQSRESQVQSIAALIRHYVVEIHTHFSDTTFQMASKVLPGALTRLFTATNPIQLLEQNFAPTSRMNIDGPIDTLRNLSETHTLVFVPTHVSNLDSPLIGYALHAAGLPPVLYGAGLNLFSNPLMSFFMSRLGAYTVDRRKQNRLYKDVLKGYSTFMLENGQHSLFYPGGTRARDGRLEENIKKGLLGTVLQAWQHKVRSGNNDGDLLIVPCTITSSLVLEAETLIDDALEDAGKSRYIISDDEFSEKRTIASFARKILSLDSSIFIHFSNPLDCIGNTVNAEGQSLGFDGQVINRTEYICDDSGNVIQDAQRDHQYTKRLAKKISDSYKESSIIVATHLVARVSWLLLRARHPHLDEIQLALLPAEDRTIQLPELVSKVANATEWIKSKQLRHCLPDTTEAIIEQARHRFSLFHRNIAVQRNGTSVVINAKLALYYGNRLAHLPYFQVWEQK